MTETFEEFTKRMALVEREREYVIGRATSGNTRTIFSFEGQCCWLESYGYRRLPDGATKATPAQMLWVASGEPRDEWVHSKSIYTKKRAAKLQKYYGASCYNEEPYSREAGKWFYLIFDTFENLMRMVFDIHTGKFKELFGDEVVPAERQEEAAAYA